MTTKSGAKDKATPPLDELFGMLTAVTGLSKDELIDGAINPEKQPELLRKISENAKPKDAIERGGTQ